MPGTITIALFVVALLSLVTAVAAIGWLSVVSKHLSALGKRVLESDDIGKIINAADKVASYESRVIDCESKAEESKKQLVQHEIKLSELTTKQGATEQRIDRHSADLAASSKKAASFELRFDEFENNVGEKLNKLLELETKVNELAAKLESVEDMVSNNKYGLTEAERNIKVLTDKIEILQKFQAATEKTHSLIQAAFTDTRTSMPSEEVQSITSKITEPEDTSQRPEDMHEQTEEQKPFGTYNLGL
jgi:chromosome segregation ATPase